MTRLTQAQRDWLTTLRDDPSGDRDAKPNKLTEISCEERGWAEYVSLGGTKMGWRITNAGRTALRAFD